MDRYFSWLYREPGYLSGYKAYLGYGLDDRGIGVGFLAEARVFSSPVSRLALRPNQCVLRREVDYSPPYNAEVRNARNYTSTLSNVFMTSYLNKRSDEFTFLSI
jgi:hypothetical protein